MPLDRNRVQVRQLADGARFDLFVPRSHNRRLLLSVLPVIEPDLPRVLAIELFHELAEEHGYLLLAPGFRFDSGFQMLGIGGAVRYDLRLLAMIDDVAREHRLAGDRVSLFGYSAGGQFAHRFLYLHPGRVERIAIGAPGTVTLPDLHQQWPFGVGGLDRMTGIRFDLAAVRRARILLYVGDQDTGSDKLDQSAAANRFGLTRVERARTLHAAWLEASIPHEYVEVSGMKHDDNQLEIVRDFLSRH